MKIIQKYTALCSYARLQAPIKMAKQGLYPLPESLEEWGVMTAAWQIFYGPLFRPEPHPHPKTFGRNLSKDMVLGFESILCSGSIIVAAQH